MEQLSYFYCRDCNTAVDTRVGVCKCNPPKKFNKARKTFPTYSKEEVDEKIRQRLQEQEAPSVNEVGVMSCPSCGKRYGREQSLCTCGMLLIYDGQSVVVENTQRETSTERNSPENNGEILEQADWKLKVYRYVNGKREAAERDIKIDRARIPLGRKSIGNAHIFSGSAEADRKSFGKVSAYSAILTVENGQLYIEHDYDEHKGYKGSSQKSKIYINGILLEENERRVLSEDDCIILGKGVHKCMDFNLEIIAKRIETNVMYDDNVMQIISEIAKDVQGLHNKADRHSDVVVGLEERIEHNIEVSRQILSNTDEIKGSIEELRSIQIENFADVNSYMKAVKQYEENVLTKNKEKNADDYLKAFLKDTPNAEEFIASLNDVQLYYLKSAAVVDVSTTENKIEGVDYSGIFIYLAKIVENYLNNTLKAFMEKYFSVVWERAMNGGSSHSAYNEAGELVGTVYTIGVFIKALNWDNKYVEKNPWADKYKKIASDANAKDKQLKYNREKVANAFAMFEKIYGIRNSSAHSVLEAVMTDKVVKVDYDKYLEAKKQIIQTTALLDLSKCYKAIFGGEK